MRHRKKHVKLSRPMGARAQLLRSLATGLILHERIRTTAAKARAMRPFVERCISVSRTPTLMSRRTLVAALGNSPAVAKLLEVIGPRYRTRSGGYTRTTRIGQRAGDAAPIVLIELV